MTPADRHALQVGKAVLAGGVKGLAKVNAARQARAKLLGKEILDLAAADVLKGHPGRGRAGRLARLMNRSRHRISERHVKRILDTLSGVSVSPAYSAPQ